MQLDRLLYTIRLSIKNANVPQFAQTIRESVSIWKREGCLSGEINAIDNFGEPEINIEPRLKVESVMELNKYEKGRIL